MKYIWILALLATSTFAQEIPIADSVRESHFSPPAARKQVCVDAVNQLQAHTSKIGATMFYMETHPETGYDIRHEDRTQINVLIDQYTDPILDAMNKAAYRGDSKRCLDKLAEGVNLANKIYRSNIQYRKINANY